MRGRNLGTKSLHVLALREVVRKEVLMMLTKQSKREATHLERIPRSYVDDLGSDDGWALWPWIFGVLAAPLGKPTARWPSFVAFRRRITSAASCLGLANAVRWWLLTLTPASAATLLTQPPREE